MTCRICYENNASGMISPCLCKGEIEYIHKNCLNQWRATSAINYNKCPSCNYIYDTEDVKISVYMNILISIYKNLPIISMLLVGIFNHIYDIIILYLLNRIDTNNIILSTIESYYIILSIPIPLLILNLALKGNHYVILEYFGFFWIMINVSIFLILCVPLFIYFKSEIAKNIFIFYSTCLFLFFYILCFKDKFKMIDIIDNFQKLVDSSVLNEYLKNLVLSYNLDLHHDFSIVKNIKRS